MKYFLLVSSLILVVSCSTMTLADKKLTTGAIVFGPERTSFIPCYSEEEYWLSADSFDATNWIDAKDILDLQAECNLMTMPCISQSVAVRGYADIQTDKQSGYGHLRAYSGEVTFTAFETVSEKSLCEIAR